MHVEYSQMYCLSCDVQSVYQEKWSFHILYRVNAYSEGEHVQRYEMFGRVDKKLKYLYMHCV